LVLKGIGTVKEKTVRLGIIIESECLVVVWIIKLVRNLGRLLESRMTTLEIL
jgi:hypothetical protein